MSIRVEARAAWEVARNDRSAEARAGLLGVLAGLTVEMDVEDIRNGMVVFSNDGVFLGVHRRESVWVVKLVERDPNGAWRETGEPAVTSLAHLHELLPPAPSVSAWSVGVDVSVGEKYSYDGTVYTVVQAHRTQADWTPPAVPALWSVA